MSRAGCQQLFDLKIHLNIFSLSVLPSLVCWLWVLGGVMAAEVPVITTVFKDPHIFAFNKQGGCLSELPGMGVFCFHVINYNYVTWSTWHCSCGYLPWAWAHCHSQTNIILLGRKWGKWILERQHTLSATVTNGVLSASSFYIPVQRGFIISTHPGLTWWFC